MADAGYFRGTSAEQDNRFSDKEKKLLKQMRFADSIATKVEMARIDLESIKPWISQRISELLGLEDEVVQEFVYNQLEADKFPDGRRIQINLTGFLNGKNARIFTGELWDMLISAQESPNGVPASLAIAKKEELRIKTEEQEKLSETLRRTVSRFQDKLRDDSPPNNKKGRSPSPSRRNKEVPKKEYGLINDPRKDEQQSQNRRQYRSRKSNSRSPSPAKERSRSRSRDRGSRYDRNTERRDRNRRSRSRSPRYNRDRDRGERRRSRSPIRPRPIESRRDYVSSGDRDRGSQRKFKSDSFDAVERPKGSSRSPTPIKVTKIKEEPTEVEESVAVEMEMSPEKSSDSGSPRGKQNKRSPTSQEEDSPDQSKKSKKKTKKHKKHKKHKKSKQDEEPILPAEDLEKALRERALLSLKRAMKANEAGGQDSE